MTSKLTMSRLIEAGVVFAGRPRILRCHRLLMSGPAECDGKAWPWRSVPYLDRVSLLRPVSGVAGVQPAH